MNTFKKSKTKEGMGGKPPERKITEQQKKKLADHKIHHTSKHMTEMRRLMKMGKSFTEAHRMTQKKIAK